jgi:hypothetical protein
MLSVFSYQPNDWTKQCRYCKTPRSDLVLSSRAETSKDADLWVREQSSCFQFPILIVVFGLSNLLHGANFTLLVTSNTLFQIDKAETAPPKRPLSLPLFFLFDLPLSMLRYVVDVLRVLAVWRELSVALRLAHKFRDRSHLSKLAPDTVEA